MRVNSPPYASDTPVMGQAVHKFQQRSPRYAVQSCDDQRLRFSKTETDGNSESYSSRLVDISTTGLGFVVDRDDAPGLGDLIKVEFHIDNQGFAWWARVVRLREYLPEDLPSFVNQSEFISDDVLVGIEFQDVPLTHQELIEKHLESKFVDLIQRQNKENISRLGRLVSKNFRPFLIYGLCILITLGLLAWLARPIHEGDRYDPDKGAVWGKRFQWGP